MDENAGRIDAVLPLTLRDAPRARTLRRSAEAFFPDLGTCFVVAPDAECAAVRAEVGGRPYEVLPESSLVPELALFPEAKGWYRQQLAKLAAARLVGSAFYLTLDADVFFVRPTRYADLVSGGRALAYRYRRPVHDEWYAWAERLLGRPRSGWTHAVTPAVLSREAVLALQDYLTSLDGPGRRLRSCRPRDLRRPSRLLAGGWRALLLREIPWTEYGLYNTFLEAEGLYERYHLQAECIPYGNCVWEPGDWPGWDPAASFRREEPFFFTVVQSNTGVDPAEVEARVLPFLVRDGAPA